jgi:hypothetical protein
MARHGVPLSGAAVVAHPEAVGVVSGGLGKQPALQHDLSRRLGNGLAGCRWRRGSAYAGAVSAILSWWDGVELWLSGLGFVVQTIVVMPVVLALAYGIAILLDGALGIRVLRRARGGDQSEQQ